MPSEQQIGIIGGREATVCAVSGKDVRGRHSVTHYKGDNVHYVRVLNQYDHLWNEAAPSYDFPVHEEQDPNEPAEGVFVLDALKPEMVNVYDHDGVILQTIEIPSPTMATIEKNMSKPRASTPPATPAYPDASMKDGE